ncbi:MAG: hypothetical protein QXR93_06820 [Archaeoglobaceae archaeon]
MVMMLKCPKCKSKMFLGFGEPWDIVFHCKCGNYIVKKIKELNEEEALEVMKFYIESIEDYFKKLISTKDRKIEETQLKCIATTVWELERAVKRFIQFKNSELYSELYGGDEK